MYLQRWHGWCLTKLLPSQRVLCTPYNHAPCHFTSTICKKKKKSTNATEIKILHFYCCLIHVETSISASSTATSTSTCSSVVATGKEIVTMVRLSLAVVLLVLAVGEIGCHSTSSLSLFIHCRAVLHYKPKWNIVRTEVLRTYIDAVCLIQTHQRFERTLIYYGTDTKSLCHDK